MRKGSFLEQLLAIEAILFQVVSFKGLMKELNSNFPRSRSRRVVGSNPIWDSDFFRVYVSPIIYINHDVVISQLVFHLKNDLI